MNIPKRNSPARAGVVALGAQKWQRLVRGVSVSRPFTEPMKEIVAPKKRRWFRGR